MCLHEACKQDSSDRKSNSHSSKPSRPVRDNSQHPLQIRHDDIIQQCLITSYIPQSTTDWNRHSCSGNLATCNLYPYPPLIPRKQRWCFAHEYFSHNTLCNALPGTSVIYSADHKGLWWDQLKALEPTRIEFVEINDRNYKMKNCGMYNTTLC